VPEPGRSSSHSLDRSSILMSHAGFITCQEN
jgi:hypothetical protein